MCTVANSTQKLWHYLVESRPLIDDFIAYDWRYTYFTNKEVAKLLETLSFYKTDDGIKHLKQIQDNEGWERYNHIQKEVTGWQVIFKEILEQEQDFFGIIA